MEDEESGQQPQERKIPIIDISPFLTAAIPKNAAACAAVARAWDDAFCSVGFAMIVGHGVPTDLIAEFRTLAQQFFAQDLHVKMQYHRGKYGDPAGGYYAVGHEVVSRSRDAMGSDGGGGGDVTTTAAGSNHHHQKHHQKNHHHHQWTWSSHFYCDRNSTRMIHNRWRTWRYGIDKKCSVSSKVSTNCPPRP
jgi:isopenicillin N synthase-like dioxygenase